MAAVIKRTANSYGIYEYHSIVHTPNYPTETWLRNPNLSGVDGVESKYWKVSGETVVEMSQGEKDAVDAALEEYSTDQTMRMIASPVDVYRVFDDFTGPTVNWYKFAQDKVGANSLVQVVPADFGQVLIRSGGQNGDYATLTTGEYSFKAAHNLAMQSGFKLDQTSNLYAYVGFWRDWSNKCEFRADSGYWYTTTSNGGSHSVVQSAVTLDTDFHHFEIQLSTVKAVFKIDGTVVGEHYDNLPVDLMYFRAQIARASGSQPLDSYFDYISIDGQRTYQ